MVIPIGVSESHFRTFEPMLSSGVGAVTDRFVRPRPFVLQSSFGGFRTIASFHQLGSKPWFFRQTLLTNCWSKMYDSQ